MYGPLWFGSECVRKTETVISHRGSSALTDLKLAGKQSVAVRVTLSSKFYYLWKPWRCLISSYVLSLCQRLRMKTQRLTGKWAKPLYLLWHRWAVFSYWQLDCVCERQQIYLVWSGGSLRPISMVSEATICHLNEPCHPKGQAMRKETGERPPKVCVCWTKGKRDQHGHQSDRKQADNDSWPCQHVSLVLSEIKTHPLQK